MNVIEANGPIEREVGHSKGKNISPLARATDTSSKGATNVSSKQVHVLNTRAGLFHVRKCPPHVAGQTPDNYHHSYQILSTFYMPVIVLHTL